tara:strand:+ start:17 stop:391 length:375 start_codon:yes stop_codon:yes gene_type:complete
LNTLNPEEDNMEKLKVRITAKEDNCRRFAVVFMGEKVAVAFSRDSGAKVAYGVRMLDGNIDSGGSQKNWYCKVDSGSVFELEVDEESFMKNRTRVKKWDIEVIEDYSMSEPQSIALRNANDNLE